MKKTTLGLFLTGIMTSSLLADWDIKGQITAVDSNSKTVTIQGMSGSNVVQILPYTELKGDDCGQWGNDIYGTFTDLKQGMFVEAEVYPAGTKPGMPMGVQNTNNSADANGAQFVAKEIEWKCMPKAY